MKYNWHLLNFEKALAYFQDNLIGTNALSSALMKVVDFNLGRFFTLLPENADLQRIYQFRSGWMASGVRNLIPQLVLEKLNHNHKLFCVFDDSSGVFEPGYDEPLFLSNGLVYEEKELYYQINIKTASLEKIKDFFYVSNAIWHSLCVLSVVSFEEDAKKKLTLEKINEICVNAQVIIVGAYDAEGYVFWKKNSMDSSDLS